MTDRFWDPRLDQRGARLVPAIVQPGQKYWYLAEARWQNEQESGGKHHIFMEPVDLPCRVWWSDGEVWVVKDFPMFAAGTGYNIQPDNGFPADAVHGLGLGSIEQPHHAIHAAYHLRWERRVAGGEAPPPPPPPRTLEERVSYLEEEVRNLWTHLLGRGGS